jgi:hypothetical protein
MIASLKAILRDNGVRLSRRAKWSKAGGEFEYRSTCLECLTIRPDCLIYWEDVRSSYCVQIPLTVKKIYPRDKKGRYAKAIKL